MGVTTATASVTPAAKPAKVYFSLTYSGNQLSCKYSPKKIPPTLVFPVSLFANQPLYVSKLANRMAIFGTIPANTAPNPLYNARGVSRCTMDTPVAINPRGLPCS